MFYLAILVALIVLIFFMKANLRITYYREGANDEVVVILSTLLGLVNVKGEVNLAELILRDRGFVLETKSELEVTKKGRLIKELGKLTDYRDIYSGMLKVREMVRVYRDAGMYLISKASVSHLHWDTRVGTRDAAITGIIAGLLWNVKTLVLYILKLHVNFTSPPEISIKPDFNNAVLYTKFDCILTFKIGHAIIAGLKGLIAKIRDGD